MSVLAMSDVEPVTKRRYCRLIGDAPQKSQLLFIDTRAASFVPFVAFQSAATFDHYAGTVFSYGPKALEAGTVRQVASRWLRGAARATTGAATPAGCLLVHGALVTGDAASEVKADVCTRRQAGELMLTERFERARLSGDLPAGVDPKDAARYVLALTEGMAVQAAYGADRAALERLVDLALDRLPWERAEAGTGPGVGPGVEPGAGS